MKCSLSYPKHTLALIVMFIGDKIVAGQFGLQMSSVASLAVTLTLFFSGVVFSWWKLQRGGAAALRRQVHGR